MSDSQNNGIDTAKVLVLGFFSKYAISISIFIGILVIIVGGASFTFSAVSTMSPWLNDKSIGGCIGNARYSDVQSEINKLSEDNSYKSKLQTDLDSYKSKQSSSGCVTVFDGEITVPIGGTLQPDGTYKKPAGNIGISDSWRAHKARGGGSLGGLDIYAPLNTPMLAATAGTVLSVGSREGGNGIIVDAGNGVRVWYWHAEKVFVKPGDTIKPGETIALIGSTGNSTGSHLHIAIWIKGDNIDPYMFFLEKGIDLYAIFGNPQNP